MFAMDVGMADEVDVCAGNGVGVVTEIDTLALFEPPDPVQVMV